MLQIISEIINYTLLGSYGLSTIITVLNNSSSNTRIRRKGFDIKPITDNSIIENIKYGIKDFGFLIVPIYNLIKSIKQTAKKDSVFDSEKMERLIDRDRLVKKEEKTEKNTSSKEKTSKEEPKREPKRVEETKKKEKTLDEMTCYERRDYYKNEYNKLLVLRNRCKQEGKSVALLNEISRRMQPIVDEYKKANKECELEDLRTERNIILSSMNEPKQLIRK